MKNIIKIKWLVIILVVGMNQARGVCVCVCVFVVKIKQGVHEIDHATISTLEISI